VLKLAAVTLDWEFHLHFLGEVDSHHKGKGWRDYLSLGLRGFLEL